MILRPKLSKEAAMRRSMWRPSRLTVYQNSRLAGNANLECIIANSELCTALTRVYGKPRVASKRTGRYKKAGFS